MLRVVTGAQWFVRLGQALWLHAPERSISSLQLLRLRTNHGSAVTVGSEYLAGGPFGS